MSMGHFITENQSCVLLACLACFSMYIFMCWRKIPHNLLLTIPIQDLACLDAIHGMRSMSFPAVKATMLKWPTKVKDHFVIWSISLNCVITDHNKRVKIIHEKNEINISKTTHAGHSYTAKMAREFGASVDSVKALGNWSDSDAYHAVYDRALAKEAMWGAAMFDARRPERYCLPRLL